MGTAQKEITLFLWLLTAKYASFLLYIFLSIKSVMYFGLLVNAALICFCLRFLKLHSLQRSFAILYISFIVSLTLWGLYNQNWMKYILVDILVWGLGIVVLIGSRDRDDELKKRLAEWVGAWMVVGVPLSWFLMFKYGFFPGDLFFGERFAYLGDLSEQAHGIFAPIQPVYVSVYAAPFFSEIKGIRRIAVCLGIGTILVFGLFTVTRQFIIIPLLAFGTIFMTQEKSVGKHTLRKLTFLMFLFAFFVSFWVMVYGGDTLQSARKSFIERMTSSGLTRNLEFEIYWESQAPVQKVVGRGIGGSNMTWIWRHLPYGVAMLHYGIGHVILKGGIIFAFFIYGVTLWSLCKLWRYPHKRCWFFVIVIFTATSFAHTEWGRFNSVVFFWLAISQAMNCRTRLSSGGDRIVRSTPISPEVC